MPNNDFYIYPGKFRTIVEKYLTTLFLHIKIIIVNTVVRWYFGNNPNVNEYESEKTKRYPRRRIPIGLHAETDDMRWRHAHIYLNHVKHEFSH